jgi:hypothetical protein
VQQPAAQIELKMTEFGALGAGLLQVIYLFLMKNSLKVSGF